MDTISTNIINKFNPSKDKMKSEELDLTLFFCFIVNAFFGNPLLHLCQKDPRFREESLQDFFELRLDEDYLKYDCSDERIRSVYLRQRNQALLETMKWYGHVCNKDKMETFNFIQDLMSQQK